MTKMKVVELVGAPKLPKKSEDIWRDYAPEIPISQRDSVMVGHTINGRMKSTRIVFTWREE